MSKRIDYVDILRGIGIFFMVFGHIRVYPTLDHYFHAFHMPLFFFVSGLFFKRHNSLSFFSFLKKMTRQLLLPYLIWGILFFLYDNVSMHGLNPSWQASLSHVLTFNNDGLPVAGALWFLTSFYICQILIFVLSKVSKKEYTFGILCMIFFLIGIYYHKLFKFELWWSMSSSFVGIGLVYMGYFINKHNLIKKWTNSSLLYAFALFIMNFVFIIKTGYVNMRTGTYPNPILFTFNFIVAMICYINISQIILKIKKLKFLSSKIMYIGKFSIVSLCLNQFVITIWSKILNKLNFYNVIVNMWNLPTSIYSMTLFLLTIISLYLIAYISMNTKLKILFGK